MREPKETTEVARMIWVRVFIAVVYHGRMVDLWRKYIHEVLIVVRKPRYGMLGLGVATVIMIIFSWLPNWGLIQQTANPRLMIALIGSLLTNYHTLDLVMLLSSALLAGLQTAMVMAHLSLKVKVGQEAGLSVVGIVSSLLGVGCASCGSILITSLFGIGTTGVIAQYLPLGGMEFGLVGIVILVVMIMMTAKKLHEAKFCQIK